jgi:beta-lactamase regulating signal transducer with metallopeptidase domain
MIEPALAERVLVEYLANAAWQIPLLVAGAWLLLRMVQPGPVAQHRTWLLVLGLALLLPLHGVVYRKPDVNPAQAPSVAVTQATFSRNALSGDAFDTIGEPGGLIFGLPGGVHSRASVELSLSRLGTAARVRRVRLNATTARWIVGLYLAVATLGVLRLVWAWRGARRLVQNSREIDLSERERAALVDCSRRMRVKTPEVRELQISQSRGISGPVVVGAVKPMLLWPENFARDLLAQQRGDELMAALCHEMAHIRRHDYLANLLCTAAVLPLKWHPAAYVVDRRIRSTREMVCDAMASHAMESETAYAKCLLSLAQRMFTGNRMAERAVESAAAGLFNGNALEERMMRLMQGKTAMSMRAKLVRGAAGAAAITAAVVMSVVFHVVPATAQAQAEQSAAPVSGVQSGVQGGVQGGVSGGVAAQSAQAAPAPVPQATPVTPVAPAIPATPATPVTPVAPLTPVTPIEPVAPIAPESPQTKDTHSRMTVIMDGQQCKLTPEEKARIAKQLAEAQQRIAEATAKINSPEFRKQIEDAQQRATAEQKIDSAELQKQMAEAQQKIAEATAKINSPEFRQQMEEAQRDAEQAARKMNSAELQKQMADAQRQIAEATARLNSPEFRQQLAEAQRKAMEAEQKMNSPEFQKQMADAQKRLADALAKLKAEQEQNNSK